MCECVCFLGGERINCERAVQSEMNVMQRKQHLNLGKNTQGSLGVGCFCEAHDDHNDSGSFKDALKGACVCSR